MTVRFARSEDAASIAEIWNHYIRNTVVTFASVEKSPREIADLIEQRRSVGHATFVIQDGEDVTGFASYAQFRSGSGYMRTLEHTVLIAPLSTGAGRGRSLLKAILEHARDAGGHSIYAGISSGNPGAVAFHAALGFEDAGILPEAGWKDSRWWDLYLMRCWL